MGRTIESYLNEAGTMLEERLLDFADETVWPTDILLASVAHDYKQMELVKDNPDRVAMIGRSIAQKEFELGQRIHTGIETME